MSNLAPIALFVYNRPSHTKQTINALKNNQLALESELFVFSDGAKNASGEPFVNEVREYLKTISGFKKITIEVSESNKGLAASIISGVTKIVNQFGKVIVLEDDLVTSKYFLQFMNDGLSFYEKNDEVISIHGYIYPVKKFLPETFFLKGADCWGWATWKRGWDLFDPNGVELLAKLKEKKLTKKFDLDGCYPYTQMLRNQVEGKNNSWAVRWHASAFLANKFTLYPGKSLVTNIGLDGSGTHCGSAHSFNFDFDFNTLIAIKSVPFEEDLVSKNAIKKFLKPSKGLFSRLLKKIENKSRKRERKKYGWFFTDLSWDEVVQTYGGYDSNYILEKSKNSLLAVKNGFAVHERDSFLFDHIQYSFPSLVALMWIAAQQDGKLNLIDFGGSLGSSFFQNRKFLSGLKEVKWNVVEQKNFVKCGKENFEDGQLKFYEDVDACVADQNPNILFFSNVLQYLKSPHQVIKHILKHDFEYVILDLLACLEDEHRDDLLTVQKVWPEIYEAAYPCWFFNKRNLLGLFLEKYDLIEEFKLESGNGIMIDGMNLSEYCGAIFKVKNNL